MQVLCLFVLRWLKLDMLKYKNIIIIVSPPWWWDAWEVKHERWTGVSSILIGGKENWRWWIWFMCWFAGKWRGSPLMALVSFLRRGWLSYLPRVRGHNTRECCPGNTGFSAGFKDAVEACCPEFKIILIRGIHDFFSSSCSRHLATGIGMAEWWLSQGTFCTGVIK